jgi:serine/threonine protein kinase/predicted Zn-dependent protease
MADNSLELLSKDCACQTETAQVPLKTVNGRVLPGSPPDRESVRVDGQVGSHSDEVTPQKERVPSPWPSVAGYEILEELGRGTMGVVYKARQISLQRLVALKMVRADTYAGQAELQRFTSEARVLASLQHPNIVQLFEVNLQQNCPYFAMELVTGGNLSDRLKGQPQPCRPAAQLLLTLARAIHVAHLNGIVHRDLKPANILITPFSSRNSHVQRLIQELGLHPPVFCLGTPKITDFGLAKQLDAGIGQTETGMILGTPSYMAPEQAEGNSSKVGPAADIYGLGAILYETLTGRPPFAAESHLETVLQLFQAEPVSPSRLQPKISRDLETICLKCLQKDPRRRYASAEELADDLQRFLDGEPIVAKPPSLVERLWKWARRRPALAMLSACSVLACGGLLGLVLFHQVDLRAKLGRALADERGARQAEEAASERERLVHLRDKLKNLLRAGEMAWAAQDWQKAKTQLTRARDQAIDEPALSDLQSRIEQMLRQTNQRQLDHSRLANFHRLHNEALFQATLFTGGDLASALQETRQAALEALAEFGIALDSTAKPAIDSPYYTEQQKTEIVAHCYELLVMLAETVAQPLPGVSAADKCRQAQEALAILDRAARLGVNTLAYHRRRAHYLSQTGENEAAQQERQHADTLHPCTVLDHFLLGQEQYRQGNSQQAILDFQNVLQLEPDHFWSSYYLALCWLKTQHPNQAAACLTACLGQRRDFPWLYLLRASAWSELGQFARAEADFEAALATPLSDAARYGLLVNRGVMRIRQGSLDKAMADLQQAIALRPQQYQGYVNLAQAYLKGQHLDEAAEQLDQAIRLEPAVAALYRTRARLQLLRQNHAAALADLDQALLAEKSATNPALADDQFERGRILHSQKDYAAALAAFDEVLRVRPHDARACRFRAGALLELNRLPAALAALDDCLRFGPPDAGAFRARAALRTRLGRYAGAQTDYTRALEIEADATTYAARGWCFLVADAPKLALSDFEEAIRLAPEQSDAYTGRGYSRVLLGDAQAAIADAEAALRQGPVSPRLYYNVARIYAQAVAVSETAATRSRTNIDFVSSRNCLDRALLTLTQALELQPAEAAHFWQTIVETDKALNPIRQSPEFRQLAARHSAQQVSRRVTE